MLARDKRYVWHPYTQHGTEGDPIVIVQNGEVIARNLERERMTVDEVCESMRHEQIASIDEVEWAILESNGTISFI